MQLVRFEYGDSRVILREMIEQGQIVSAVICDPPYHLESIVKRFGKPGSAAAQHGSDGRFTRHSAGFMGRAWDGAQAGVRIAFDPEFWRLCYELLPPGGFLIAFSSPRTYHRMACAIEDAGFIIHPMLGWCYGQGSPKGHAIQDESFGGHFYGTQTLKPALEPIALAQKPLLPKLTGTDNMRLFGVGALNIEDCRVEADDDEKGRWPANLLHDGSPAVLGAFPRAPGQQGKSSKAAPSGQAKNTYHPRKRSEAIHVPRSDAGSAARFFNALRFEHEDRIYYCPKASKAEKGDSDHPTVKPIALMRWLVRLVALPGSTVLDPFAGSGSTGQAALAEDCRAVLVEAEMDYAAFIRRRFNLPVELDAESAELI